MFKWFNDEALDILLEDGPAQQEYDKYDELSNPYLKRKEKNL